MGVLLYIFFMWIFSYQQKKFFIEINIFFFTFIVISAIIAQIKRLIGLPYAKLVKKLKWLCLSRSKKEEESALNYISIKQANRKTKKSRDITCAEDNKKGC